MQQAARGGEGERQGVFSEFAVDGQRMLGDAELFAAAWGRRLMGY
jgi:hypothetical protein